MMAHGAAELGKLSHRARECLGPGYIVSHRPDTGEPSLQPPPEMLRAPVGWFRRPLSFRAASQRVFTKEPPPQSGRPGSITGTRPMMDTLRRTLISALRVRQPRLGRGGELPRVTQLCGVAP